jgi:predicted component of type VI protein secretion system
MGSKSDGRDKSANIVLLRVLVDGKEIERRAFMLRERISIGRDPYTDVSLEDPTVSRLHAVIEKQEHGFVLRDRSSNGTDVNGKTSTIHTLREHDKITIGRFTIIVEFHNDSAKSLYEQAQAEGWTMDEARTLRRSDTA